MPEAPAIHPAPTPKQRRLPLTRVVFNQLTSIPGFSDLVSTCEAGAVRITGGQQVTMPVPFFDPETNTIWIEGRSYPAARAHYWERAATAFVKPQEPPPDLTIGKAAPRKK